MKLSLQRSGWWGSNSDSGGANVFLETSCLKNGQDAAASDESIEHGRRRGVWQAEAEPTEEEHMGMGCSCAGFEEQGTKIASTVEQRYKLTVAYPSVAIAGSGTLSSLYTPPALFPAPAAFLPLGAMVTMPTRLGWSRYDSLCFWNEKASGAWVGVDKDVGSK